MSDTVDFKGQCGECKDGYYTATSTAGMKPGQSAAVNGAPPNNCVIANDDAKVFQISVIDNAGFYKYQIRVDAQGPDGIFSGSMYLAFRDKTNDVYYLRIYARRRSWHTVSYNSDSPDITAIYWSNYAFTVREGVAGGAKTEFQVVSPAEAVG